MHPDTDMIVDGLLKWWHRRFPMGKGCRNPHAFNLAAACNDYGIPQPKTLAVLLRYVEQDFTAAEVRGLVRSAYRNTAAHGSKQWRGRGGGAPAPRPAYTPRLTPAQAKAVEDRLAEGLSARYAWKPWDMEPQPAAEVGATAAPPAPIEAAPQPAPAPPPPPRPDELGAWLKRGTAQERAALVRSLFTTARPRIGQHEFNPLLAQAAGTTPRAVVGSLLEALRAGIVKVHPSSLLHLP
ncbi:MAG: hypothetical protein JSS84_07250 [Bacteroidetes bacterium]|nr:hypothetical protein [Bacteroidota bacterium]